MMRLFMLNPLPRKRWWSNIGLDVYAFSAFLYRPHALFNCPEHVKANHIIRGKTAKQLFDFGKKNVDLLQFLSDSSAFKKKVFSTDELRPDRGYRLQKCKVAESMGVIDATCQVCGARSRTRTWFRCQKNPYRMGASNVKWCCAWSI